VLFWTGAVVNIHCVIYWLSNFNLQFLDTTIIDNIGLLFLFVGAPLVATTVVSYIEGKQWTHLKSDTKTFKKDFAFELYSVILINLVLDKGIKSVINHHLRKPN
jgi:hypothetical protein